MSLTSPDFTMCHMPCVRAQGDQPGDTHWGCHRTRGAWENTLLKWLRFTELTCIVVLDKVWLARCVLAMLQTALGFPLKSAATALAGRTAGVKPSLPHCQERFWSLNTNSKPPCLPGTIRMQRQLLKNSLFCLGWELPSKTNEQTNKKKTKITLHFFLYMICTIWWASCYITMCPGFNNSSSQMADAGLRDYSWFSLPQLRWETCLSLCMTRRDTHRKDLAATYKDKALKNRIQEETKLTAFIHIFLLFTVLTLNT